MGKPMKNRILTIALALSLLATVFVAIPTTAAYDYTGSLVTTDDDGVLKRRSLCRGHLCRTKDDGWQHVLLVLPDN
jgi:hypothetical protein